MLPARVEAAQSYLHYASGIMDRDGGLDAGDIPVVGRELSEKESACYNAALDVLLRYFLGEMDFDEGRGESKENRPGGHSQSATSDAKPD